MRIWVFTASVFMTFCVASVTCAAATIDVRGAVHDRYVRFVFEGKDELSYKFTRRDDTHLTIDFNQKNQVTMPHPIDVDDFVQGVEVDGNDNSIVHVNLLKPLKTRHFKLGQKVVLDLYLPPGHEASISDAKSPSPKDPAPDTQKQNTAQDHHKATEETPTASTEATVNHATDHGENHETQPQPEKNIEPEKAAEPEKIPPHVAPNLITVSSTTSTAMAIFQLYDDLWLINDREDLLLRPQVSGANADAILPVENFEIESGKAFKVKALDDAKYVTQGGGLLWRLVIASNQKEPPVIRPLRVDVPVDQSRGGAIILPFSEVGEILDFTDPYSGMPLKIVTAKSASSYMGQGLEFLEFDILPSPLGAAIMPKVDDLEVYMTADGVKITRPGGLLITPQSDVQMALERKRQEAKIAAAQLGDNAKPIFHFKDWMLGDNEAVRGNHQVIASKLGSAQSEIYDEGLLNIARMYIAHGYGAEGLGMLRLIRDKIPDIETHPEYEALYGVALALSYHSEEAFKKFVGNDFEDSDELRYWKSYALADLGDWQQAEAVLPLNFGILRDYPDALLIRVALRLTEVALRAGDMQRSEKLLEIVSDLEDQMNAPQHAALAYLRGESARQNGDDDSAYEYWEELARGDDDYYRARAGLAITRLEMQLEEITGAQAVDQLERLRYAWRGDDLEARINYWLGYTYFDAGEFVKGLNIMRDAASFAHSDALRAQIASEMSDVFAGLFLDRDRLANVSPPEAAALYQNFAELMPTGDRGNEIAHNLAEHLVASDIFDRADVLFQYQLDNKLSGIAAARTAIRLAAIRLIDKRPADAQNALNLAKETVQALPAADKPDQIDKELIMLQASIDAKNGHVEDALESLRKLPKSEDVNRLRADIAWRAAYWDDAAESLGDVIVDRNISVTRPPELSEQQLILQHAVALNLAGDRIRLSNTRERHSQIMNQTPKAKVFEVITRPRQSAVLADRRTLQSIVSEVDLFSDFLESYKNGSGS